MAEQHGLKQLTFLDRLSAWAAEKPSAPPQWDWRLSFARTLPKLGLRLRCGSLRASCAPIMRAPSAGGNYD
jgi:hypothetical protein